MSCILPPVCVFCENFLEHDPERECKAFVEIPEVIMCGEFDHTEAYPDDNGYRFQLTPSEMQTFLELNEIRQEFGLAAFRLPQAHIKP